MHSHSQFCWIGKELCFVSCRIYTFCDHLFLLPFAKQFQWSHVVVFERYTRRILIWRNQMKHMWFVLLFTCRHVTKRYIWEGQEKKKKGRLNRVKKIENTILRGMLEFNKPFQYICSVAVVYASRKANHLITSPNDQRQ